MLAVQPDDSIVGAELVEDVHRLRRLNEPVLDRPQIDVRHPRRLAIEDLRIRRVAELGFGPVEGRSDIVFSRAHGK